ncbi:MAG TPA: heme-binding domain-containing protein [Methylomirabilota bacterium]|nr:heme-binding domain-containing protein [Methylomirabilota bacterium]
MKRWLKRSGLALVVLLAGIQFVPITRTNPPERGTALEPREVRALLQRSCYDCHSNETRWPWYSQIAPVSFLIAGDVKEGRREVNFSLWDGYNVQIKARKLGEIAKQVERGAMPQWYYVLMHPEAKLSQGEKEAIVKWARQS